MKKLKVRVVKIDSFDAAHFLPNYVGKCKNLHGHHWMVEVGLSGEINQDTGMVIDFSEVKGAMKPLLDILDHNLVNVVIQNPTAENIATYIFNWLEDNWCRGSKIISLEFVRVWETEDSYAEVSSGS